MRLSYSLVLAAALMAGAPAVAQDTNNTAAANVTEANATDANAAAPATPTDATATDANAAVPPTATTTEETAGAPIVGKKGGFPWGVLGLLGLVGLLGRKKS